MLPIEYEGTQQRNSSPCSLAQYLLNIQRTGETKGREQCRIRKGCLLLKNTMRYWKVHLLVEINKRAMIFLAVLLTEKWGYAALENVVCFLNLVSCHYLQLPWICAICVIIIIGFLTAWIHIKLLIMHLF